MADSYFIGLGLFFSKVIYSYKHNLSHTEVSWAQLSYECDKTFYTVNAAEWIWWTIL